MQFFMELPDNGVASKNSALTINTRERTEGAYLNIYQATWGNIAQVRAADYAKHEIKQGTKQQLYDLNMQLVYPIYRRYLYDNSDNGFILNIESDGILYIQPIGQDITTGSAINFSETFIIRQ